MARHNVQTPRGRRREENEVARDGRTPVDVQTTSVHYQSRSQNPTPAENEAALHMERRTRIARDAGSSCRQSRHRSRSRDLAE